MAGFRARTRKVQHGPLEVSRKKEENIKRWEPVKRVESPLLGERTPNKQIWNIFSNKINYIGPGWCGSVD